MPPFIDTNVILRHLLSDVPGQSEAATAYFRQVENAERQIEFTEPIVFEAVFMLERVYRHPKTAVRDAIVQLLDLRGSIAPNREVLIAALNLHVERNISLPDAYIAVRSLDNSGEVISFDRDFDRIPGLRRIEPGAD